MTSEKLIIVYCYYFVTSGIEISPESKSEEGAFAYNISSHIGSLRTKNLAFMLAIWLV